MSWDSFWDAAVSHSEKGWCAEIAIPLSTLRFQTMDNNTIMGLIVYRYVARKQELVTFPAISPEFGYWSFIKPSQAQKVRFTGIRSSSPLYVKPYVLGGAEQNFPLNNKEDEYVKKETYTSELGLDVKYGLTSNLTLDATINTDFAQVEADNYKVNLTRFSLFFPEKRLFFQERASNFEVNLNGDNRIFHSRTIGIHEGKPVPIIGGIRLVGRTGNWDVGILNMQTAEITDFASENFGVYRFRRQVLNPQSYLGVITTTRMSAAGRYNIVGGFDGILRLFKYDYLTFNFARSFEDHASGKDKNRIRLYWEKRRFDGLAYDIDFSLAGKDYNPGLGYEQRTDVTLLGSNIYQGWIPGKNALIQRHRIILNGQVYYHNSDKHVESYDFGPAWDVTFKSGQWLYFEAQEIYDNVTEPFYLSPDDSVLAGKYTFRQAEISYGTSQLRLLRATTTILGGTYYDGHRVSFMFEPEWILSRYLTISAAAEFNWIDFPQRHQSLSSHVGRARIAAALNTKFSGSSFVQYNRATKTILANFRLRYNPREGVDFYFVYNDDLNMKRERELPVLPVTNNRTILLKFSYTFLL